MRQIYARNVNEGLPLAVAMFKDCGIQNTSRNGTMLEVPGPVTTHFWAAQERVLFSPVRDANPFFHLFEALWMLNGRRDVKFVAQFNKQMETFSDDGKIFNGAYGYRWRFHYAYDQIEAIIALLRKDPFSRRAVLTMWEPKDLQNQKSKDLPCNTQIFFSLRGGYLTMTVVNRSNDVLWGAYGANVVHMTMLQEYVAGRLGCGLGSYCVLSNSFHVYPDLAVTKKVWAGPLDAGDDPYACGEVTSYPLFDYGKNPEAWNLDLALFFEDPYTVGYTHSYWHRVIKPMWALWKEWKGAKRPKVYDELLGQMPAGNDWRRAASEWLARRISK